MRPAGTTTAYTRARKNMCARLEGSPPGGSMLTAHAFSENLDRFQQETRAQNNGQRNGQRYRRWEKVRRWALSVSLGFLENVVLSLRNLDGELEWVQHEEYRE